MAAWPNSKNRLIAFSRKPLGWPGGGDDDLDGINTPRNMGKTALDEPPTGATPLSFVPEDPDSTGQQCFESDVQCDLSPSSIPPIFNDFMWSHLEAPDFGSLSSAPSISLHTPEGNYIPQQIPPFGDTPQAEPKRSKLNHYASYSPPHSYETAYPSDNGMFPNTIQADNTFNEIICNNISYNLSPNMDEGQGRMQNMIPVNTVSVSAPLAEAYQELQMGPSQTRTYPNVSSLESPQTVFPLPGTYQPLLSEEEFLSGESAQCNGEVPMLGFQTQPESFPHISFQMTAEDAYLTSLFVKNLTFPAPDTNETSYNTTRNERRVSLPHPSPECNDDPPVPFTNQSAYSHLNVPMDMLHIDDSGESTQPQPALGEAKFIYKHTLLKPTLIRNSLNRDDSGSGSCLTPVRPIDRIIHRSPSPQDISVKLLQEKGKTKAVEPPIRERKSLSNYRPASKPYYRHIRAKSPGSVVSTLPLLDLTTDSPPPRTSLTPTSEVGTYLTWCAKMGETSSVPEWPVNIPFDTRKGEANITPGIALSELKRLNFVLLAVSEILDNPNWTPLFGLPTMTELFVLFEWPIQMKQNDRHKVVKLDRPINRFSRVDILCKVAKRLYECIRKDETNLLDPNKLRIISLSQQVDNKELWIVKIAGNSQDL